VQNQETGGLVKTLEEFAEHLTRHGWIVSYRTERARDRPLTRQTVTAQQGEFFARAVYTRRKVKTDADQIDFNFSGSVMEQDDESPRWCTFKNQDELMRFVHEYDRTLLTPAGPPPTTGGKRHRCRCGKVRHYSEAEAQAVLRKAKRQRLVNGDTRRHEERYYACPDNEEIFHLTSLKEWVDRTEQGETAWQS
jgi:hypothetical protein